MQAAQARARDAAKALGFDLNDGDMFGQPGESKIGGLASSEPETFEAYVFLPAGTSNAAAAAVLADWADWATSVVTGYVWSSEPLRLRLVEPGSLRARRAGFGAPYPGSGTDAATDLAAPVLYGRMYFGDAQGDEWWAVWLLNRLTMRYPGSIVHVYDSDGDIIAIEAADLLPRWFKPETAANRTFLLEGRVHLLPKPRGSEVGLAVVPSLAEGAAFVRDNPAETLAPLGVQAAVRARLATFPGAAAESLHVARCVLPDAAARVLSRDPSLVAPAITAFYGRDPSDVQRAARMRAFPPAHGFLPVSVRLSRMLAAQLLMQRYHPPVALSKAAQAAQGASESESGRFGSSSQTEGENGTSQAAPLIKTMSAADLPRLGAPEYRSWDLGLKVTAGLEILLWQGSGWKMLPWLTAPAAGSATSPAAGGEDIDGLARYIATLTRRGYFEGCRTAGEKAAKTQRAQEYWAQTRTARTASEGHLPPAPRTVDGATLEDAAEEVVSPPSAAGGRLEHPSVRIARALLAVCGPDGAPLPPAGAWPPPSDRNDSWAWLEEAPDAEGDEAAALEKDRRRLTALSQSMLTQLRLEPEPEPRAATGAGASKPLGGMNEADDEDAGAARKRDPGVMHFDEDTDSAGDDDDEGDFDDDDDVDVDDDSDGTGGDGGDSAEASGEIQQLNELMKSLGGFLKGASGVEGVAPKPEAAGKKADAAPASDAGFGAGFAKSALSGAFNKSSSAKASSTAPAAKPKAKRTKPTVTAEQLQALLDAHAAAVAAAQSQAGQAGVAATAQQSTNEPSSAPRAAASSATVVGLGQDTGAAYANDEDDDDEFDDDMFASPWNSQAARDAAAARVRAVFGTAQPQPSSASSAARPGAARSSRVRFADADDSDEGASSGDGASDGDDASMDSEPEPSLGDVMAAMDRALQGTSIGSSFATLPRGPGAGDDDDGSDGEAPAPLPRAPGGPAGASGALLDAGRMSEADVRYNLVTSLMESVGGQAGAAGPASNLLGQLGVAVPKQWWKGAGNVTAAAAEETR